ncbi:MAG: class I SAM-dependent methyltransferase [Opitutae bacterium]|nr:class I SAM-dependent methyltransferase [Opitutae bacterium]MDG1300825.1 class I SAM-dependent methyltransferase [Opitutae bacterium]
MSYSSIARFYKLIESVTIGGSLLDARLAHLQRLTKGPAIQHALLVGEGNGSFLLPFVQQFPNTLITVLDESVAMLRVARNRLEAAGIDTAHITFQQADMTTEKLAEGRYDLIVTLFFFDNFDAATVRRVVSVLERVSTPSAQWLLSDFQIPTSGWRRLRARIWLTILYAFFRCVAKIPARTVPPAEAILAASSFKQVARQTYSAEMLYSTLYERA